MVEAGSAAVPALARVRAKAAAYQPRAAAVWGLYRIGTPPARAEVRAALSDPDFRVRVAAARAAGMARDREAVDRLKSMVRDDLPAARRQAATALGQIGDRRAVPALLAASARPGDRFTEHAIIYALIELEDAASAAPALSHAEPRVRKAALIALDQMPGGRLAGAQLAPLLGDRDADLRAAALWVAARHPDWSGEVLKFLEARLSAPALPAAEASPVREALIAFCSDTGVQKLVSDALGNPRHRMFLLDTMDRCALPAFPESWAARLGDLLERADPAARARALSLIRARGISSLDGALRRLAANPRAAAELRASALGALVARHPKLDAAALDFLLASLDAGSDAGVRLAAAGVLARARLTDEQLLALARRLARADALILPSLLDAFRASHSEAVGRALVAALLESRVSIGEPDARRLETILAGYPEGVRGAARPLLARVEQLRAARLERLKKMEALLASGGDIGRGRRVFFGEKVACSRCHTIGKQGGHVGPDLTAIGAIRSGHDLLEAIVFPSASFVPGHEIYLVETATDTFSGVRGDGPPGTVTLITGPDAELRIPRSEVRSMRPSTVSLMPEGLDESLSRQELSDLLAFLQGQTSREVAHAR
jgi:putative heme-binding domain-containing protein